jgi:RNA polymerase sigma-70 factor (ECF subfamily)
MHVMPEGPTDTEIIRRVLSGETNAFELLLERYGSVVFSIVTRHVPRSEVEDVAQEVFVRAYRSLAAFTGQGPFHHWLSKIAVRCSYDYWRGSRKWREVPASSLGDEHREWMDRMMTVESQEAFEQETTQQEAQETLHYLLDRIPAEDRMVLALVHLEGHSASEAAEMLGWSAVKVKVKAHRARRKLQKLINGLIDHR